MFSEGLKQSPDNGNMFHSTPSITKDNKEKYRGKKGKKAENSSNLMTQLCNCLKSSLEVDGSVLSKEP